MGKIVKSPAVSQPYIPRPGEGPLINVVSKTAFDKDGNIVQILQANMTSAPVPDRKYAGEVANAVLKRGDVRIMVGQEKVSSENLRSLVVISMGPSALRNFLESLEHLDNGGTVEGLAVRSHIERDPLTDFVEEPTSTVGFRANQIVVAIASDETCLDFYQVSASALRVGQASQKLPIDAIVRVEMKFSLFLSLLDRLKELEKKFPPESPLVLDKVSP